MDHLVFGKSLSVHKGRFQLGDVGWYVGPMLVVMGPLVGASGHPVVGVGLFLAGVLLLYTALSTMLQVLEIFEGGVVHRTPLRRREIPVRTIWSVKKLITATSYGQTEGLRLNLDGFDEDFPALKKLDDAVTTLSLISRSRRDLELQDPARQFYWGVVGMYRCDLDMTKFDAARAIAYLGHWDLKDKAALRALLQSYMKGELNPAFDGARILYLSELGRAAGWLQERDTYAYAAHVLPLALRYYRSWQAFRADIRSGRERWWPEVAKKSAPKSELDFNKVLEEHAEKLMYQVAWPQSY